jgi:hypothetical protein
MAAVSEPASTDDASVSRTKRSRAARLPAGPLVVAAVLAISVALCLSAVRGKSATFDEVAYITSGYVYWKFGDYRMQPENGNLPQRWEALALLAGGFSFPSLEQMHWWRSDVWEIGRQFFYECGNDADSILLRARLMVVPLVAGLGALVYAWSKRLFGPGGGFVSVVLCAFCPTVLAHGGLATSDLAASFFFIAALWSTWAAWHRLSPFTLLFSGLTLAGLFLSKMSALSILPVAVLLLVVRLAVGRPLEVSWPRGQRAVCGRGYQLEILLLASLGQAALVWCLIWAAFGFRYKTFHTSEPGRDMLSLPVVWSQRGLVADCFRLARDYHFLPEAYLHGVAYLNFILKERPAFLNGEFGTTGWMAFFPYCLLVKTPLTLFGLLVAAVAGAWRSAKGRVGGLWALLYDTAPLTVFLVVYWVFALTSRVDIGQRYLLPTYPVMFILAGASSWWLRLTVPRVPRLLVAFLLLAFVAESLVTWPNYLSYFNILAGGPRNAYRHLVDSSLDWGQDLPGLQRWLQSQGLENQSRTRVYLSYFGTASAEHYGIRAISLPCYFDLRNKRSLEPLRGGVYCISATMLQTVYLSCPGPWNSRYEDKYRQVADFLERRQVASFLERVAATRDDPAARRALLHQAGDLDLAKLVTEVVVPFHQLRFGRLCAYLRQREPDHQVGYSILIYHLTDEEVLRAVSPRRAEVFSPGL